MKWLYTLHVIKYSLPARWLHYDSEAVSRALVEAKSAVDALRMLPYQREWLEELERVQLKREVAGTSRIEGADFTDRELEEAMHRDPEALLTRSQRQASAAVRAYRWIARLPHDPPVDAALVKTVHRQIVTGADDDRCPPGELRGPDQNVTFGSPPHRGAEGGVECQTAFEKLIEFINGEARAHDPLIRALAFHYHFAAIHPFLDGNGRTARAMEALLLGRAGLRDVCFIAMSNYYYEEKPNYLKALSEVRVRDYDLTPFLTFGLKGVQLQTQAVLREIRSNISRALFKNVMYDLFNRLKSPRKRVIADRQLAILKHLLSSESILFEDLARQLEPLYSARKNPRKAFYRDLNNLLQLGAITLARDESQRSRARINLDWPTQITESEFFKKIKEFPKSKTYRFLS
jgi:Fic family protein